MPAKFKGYALTSSAVRRVLVALFFLSLPCALWAVPLTVIPALPEATTPVFVSTSTITLPIPQSQELPDRTMWRKNPFMPLLGITFAQKTKAKAPVSGPSDVVQLRDMELIGIVKDAIEYSGIFRNTMTGKIYITQQSKLIDKRKRTIKNISVGYIDENSVLMNDGKQETSYRLRKAGE
ncbi:MAG: hypothetical protein PHD29_02260 [bacterium]|nr:hypothetical protein [bacterium]MDD5354609.1 hypothetical protein [bacterium]MDD5755652.1 hypothetical protein [bacterium]